MFSLVNHRFNFRVTVGTKFVLIRPLRGFEGLEAKPKEEAPCERNEQKFFATTPFRLSQNAFQNISSSHFLQSFRTFNYF